MAANRWFACVTVTLTFLLMTVFVATTTPVVVAAPQRAAPAVPVAPQAALRQAASPAPVAQAGYVGASTCLTCHDDKTNLGEHGRAANPRTPMAGQGCETCHGPGQAHVDGGGDPARIRNPAKLDPSEVSATCTTCHNRGEHEFWQGSQHDRRNLTCTTCHSVHSPNSLEKQLKADSVMQTCGTCHRDKVAKLDRSSHMPVREGKLECSTCHNPHGSQNVRLLRVGNTVNEACTSCHAEKRGPFLWDHAPVRENCTTCHDPHGSANERSLVAKVPFLCQRCHSHTRHPATIYDGTQLTNSRLYTRGCVNCHSNIHGSNHPSGHTFTR